MQTYNLILENLPERYAFLKAIPTTRCVKLINKQEFTKVVLDENIKTFVGIRNNPGSSIQDNNSSFLSCSGPRQAGRPIIGQSTHQDLCQIY